MSQSDFQLNNVSAATARAKINEMAKANASNSSGASAPATTYANQLWFDTSTNRLKQRTQANDGWIDLLIVDPVSSAVQFLQGTRVVNGVGQEIGKVGPYSQSNWNAGTETGEGLISPAKLKTTIENFSQQWEDWSYTLGANEQNNGDQPIRLLVVLSTSASASVTLQVGPTTSRYTNTGVSDAGTEVIVPAGHFYRITATNTSDIAQALILS